MNFSLMVPLILVLAAVMELLVGFFVVLPRATDERAKPILRLAFVSSSLVLLGLALAFALGWLPTS